LLHFISLLWIGFACTNCTNDKSASSRGTPELYQKVMVPLELTTETDNLKYGGDIRIGDLSGNGKSDFLVYRAAEGDRKGATKPCFIGAFDIAGNILWQKGEGGIQPYRPGPIAIHDIDNDGETEVICFFTENRSDPDPFSLNGITIQVLDGKTGAIEKQSAPEHIIRAFGKGANWVHQRIFLANLSGGGKPQEFIVKLGKELFALNKDLNIIWKYYNPWDEYGECPAYIPTVGDIDQDGRDEVNGGYYLLDDDGAVMWEKKLGRNMDAVEIAPWDDDNMRAFCSGYGYVMDQKGEVVLKLGEELVPHGQELRVADFVASNPGSEMMIRYNGHQPDVITVGTDGKVLSRFQLNESPNNTGMTTVYWHGKQKPALLFNGGMLWTGAGHPFAYLPNLPPTVGDEKMGWYHCIPANICGDDREEVVTYNPWDRYLFIYTPGPLDPDAYEKYTPGPRQYNARLMD